MSEETTPSSQGQNDTPDTDAAAFANGYDVRFFRLDGPYVFSKFARTLERQRNAARAEATKLTEERDAARAEVERLTLAAGTMAQTLSLAANSAGIPLTGDVATLPTVITDIVVERDVANARADKAERERDELLKRPAKETAQLLIQAVEAQCKETAAVAKDRDEARAQLAEAHANYARAIEVGIKTNEELVQVRETCVSAVLSQHAAIERAEAFESRVKELEDDLHVKITSNMSLNRQKELLLTKRNKLEAECGRLRETLAYVRTELPEAGENVIQMEGMSYQILVPEVVVEMVGAIKAALSPNPESGNQC